LISIWSMLSGPAEVIFTDQNDPNTEASFSMMGTYVLRLTGYDGERYSFDDLSINVMDFSAMTLNVPGDYPTIQEAFYYAVAGDTLLLAPGIHELNESLAINKDNISIVSNFVTSGDENDIDTTIIKVSPLVRAIDGLLGQSANLTLKGLTIIDGLKGVTFADDYGVVEHCKFIDIKEDAISFDTNAGGSVTHTRVVNAGDDAIDIDSRYNGNFLIAYNELINSKDDSIEIHLYDSVSDSNMHHDIHDNLLLGAGEDGIQLIDFSGDSKRTFDIYRNIFQDMPDVAISAMFKETKEDFQGTAMTERVRIYNNYFYNNGYHITGGDNMIILNNIFESATMTAIKRVSGNSITDHNLFYNNPVNTENTLIGTNNIFDRNPQKNNDFTLPTGSPAIDTGTANYSHLSEVVLQIATNEYTGQNPDMGRYEYGINNTAPVITLIGVNPINLNLGDTFTDPGATAVGEVDGDISASIQAVSDVDTAIAGSYQVSYTVSDSDGNSTSVTRGVIVRDNTIAPLITLLGANPINLNIGDAYNEPGATAWDQEDGDISASIQAVSDVDTAIAGSYQMSYTVSDSDGNSTSVTRGVIVRDNTIAPLITLLGANPINLNIGDAYNEPGATAWDQEDGDLTASIETTGEESTAVANTYLLTYTVSDSDGNSASATRSVIVNSNDSGGSSGTSGSSGGGGSTNRTLLLLLTLAFLFRHSRKGKSL
jgi:hypothetical protein